MYITPNKGMTIVDPDLKDYLPEAGRDVPDTPYWRRLRDDGDVVESDPPVETTPLN